MATTQNIIMAKEITTTGTKLVSTLQKEFNANYPYLWLYVSPITGKEQVAKGENITSVDTSKPLSEVRTKKGTGQISLTGSKNIGTIEREFENIFGLYVQICYRSKDNNSFYTGKTDDSKSLTELNREKQSQDCKNFNGTYKIA